MVKVKSRIWVDKDGQEILSPGVYNILKAIEETNSIASAAKKVGYSYKFVWTYIKKLEDALGVPLVESKRGGRERGSTELTEVGKLLVKYYEELQSEVEKVVKVWESRLAQLLTETKVERGEEIPYYEGE